MLPYRFRRNDFTFGTTEIQRITGTLNNTGAALDAIFSAWNGSYLFIFVNIKTITRANLLTESDPFAFSLVQNNLQQSVIMKATFENWGTTQNINRDDEDNCG